MNQTNPAPIIIVLLVALLLPSCVSEKKPEVTTLQLIEYNKVIKEADELYSRGCYLCLKQAYELYEDVLSLPVFQKKNTLKLYKTAILLGLRERELGILQETYFPNAEGILTDSPYLEEYSALLRIASTILMPMISCRPFCSTSFLRVKPAACPRSFRVMTAAIP